MDQDFWGRVMPLHLARLLQALLMYLNYANLVGRGYLHIAFTG